MFSFSELSLCAGEPYPELENSREGDPTQGWQGIQSHMPLSLPRATIRGELTNKLRVSGGFAFLCMLPLLGLKILLFKETGLQRARDLGTPEPNSYPGLKQHDLGKKVIKNTNIVFLYLLPFPWKQEIQPEVTLSKLLTPGFFSSYLMPLTFSSFKKS